MWCISLTVQSVLGMPRPVVPLSLSHPGWASCTTTGTTPTTSTPTMLVVTYKRGVTPSEFSPARASAQGWYNTQVISSPLLHHCLCIEWTVNSEQVGYPAYLQNNCYSLIVIPSGLASKREYWIFSFIWITWALTPYPISIQSQPFSVVAHHCLL